MYAKTTIFLGLLLAISAMPMTNAGHQPNPNCVNIEDIHTYDASLGAFVTFTGPVSGTAGVAATAVGDGCELATTVYDGETEFGVAGGRFAAGTMGDHCDPVATSHHAYGEGAQYWADDETGLVSLLYSAGADGPAIVQVTNCETDGIISDDPTTDPSDCGSGDIGVWAPPVSTPATLGENAPSSGACNPFDGFVWVFIANGVDMGNGTASTPIVGHIWS